MLDLRHTVTTFTDHSTPPSPQGVQMRPIRLGYGRWERIQVEVHRWTREGDRARGKKKLVTLTQANTICEEMRQLGWTEEKWG